MGRKSWAGLAGQVSLRGGVHGPSFFAAAVWCGLAMMPSLREIRPDDREPVHRLEVHNFIYSQLLLGSYRGLPA